MLKMYDEFAGVGGTSHGASKVPGLEVAAAANHDQDAMDSHAANFPDARHFLADVTKLDMEHMPYADIFGASPACPAWTNANGMKVDFDKVNAVQENLFGDDDPDEDEDPKITKRKEEYRRSRLLMHEVIRYLRGMQEFKGRPVLGGVVENVVQCRKWAEWDNWVAEFHKLGYYTRVIAYNSMHAQPVHALAAPQSRNRLFFAYWHRSIGRHPDFDKWLRPTAYCPTCDRQVNAVQVFKEFGVDMGSYGEQYVYRCPSSSCRHREVFPETLPALAAIDPGIPGQRIADRKRPLAPATMDRIVAGIRRYWEPLLVPCGGSWRDQATPLSQPTPTFTTRESDGVALLPPFITPMRGGGDKERARSVTDPVHTITAGGNHHGLALPPLTPLVMRNNTATGDPGRMCTPITEPVRTVTTAGHQSLLFPPDLLVPYYGAAEHAVPATQPVGALTTRDRYGIGSFGGAPAGSRTVAVEDVLFRMLQPHEIARAMAFDASYRVLAKAKKTKVRLYGNAVTPPVAELLYSALVECISGATLSRERVALAA